MSKIIEIHTSCGRVFNLAVDEMSDRRLSGLIDQNPDHPDTELMRSELTRRQEKRKGHKEAMAELKAATLDGARRAA